MIQSSCKLPVSTRETMICETWCRTVGLYLSCKHPSLVTSHWTCILVRIGICYWPEWSSRNQTLWSSWDHNQRRAPRKCQRRMYRNTWRWDIDFPDTFGAGLSFLGHLCHYTHYHMILNPQFTWIFEILAHFSGFIDHTPHSLQRSNLSLDLNLPKNSFDIVDQP